MLHEATQNYPLPPPPPPRGGHCIGDCTPTRDRGQSEVKRSRRNFEVGQAVKLGIGGSLRTVKVSPGDRRAWLMLDSQGSRPNFWCGQGVKHENLLGQNLDRGRGWKYRHLCSVSPLPPGQQNMQKRCQCGVRHSWLEIASLVLRSSLKTVPRENVWPS